MSSSTDLVDLLSNPHAPGFIYLHHPHTPTSSCIPKLPPGVAFAHLSAVEYNTPRLLYSGLLHRIAVASGTEWEGGEVSTWDGFSRGLRSIWGEKSGKKLPDKQIKGSRKGKEKAAVLVNGHGGTGEEGNGEEVLNWVLIVTHAERLPRILGAQWAVLMRLSELVDVPVTIVLASQIPWDNLRPPTADAPEPIHIYIPQLSRIEIHHTLLKANQHPLWPHFVNLFLATFHPLSPSLPELQYLAGPLWQLYTSSLPPHLESGLIRSKSPPPEPDPNTDLPKLDITVKLLTDLKYSLALPLTLAIEHLLPRRIGPSQFVRHLTNTEVSISKPKKGIPTLPGMEIPLIGKFLVVSGYLAGQNPAKSDLRLFGRGLGIDGKKKRGGGTRRAGYGRVKIGKVPQRLLGPKPFPIDRLLAIFSSLYSEHAERPPDLLPSMNEGDSEEYDDYASSSSSSSSGSDEEGFCSLTRKRKREGVNGNTKGESMLERQRKRVERKRRRDIIREERWEEGVEAICMSVKLWSLIPELEAQGLFRRISPPDRLDNIMLRCETDYDSTKVIARELRLTLDEYLYEAQM